MLTSKLGTHRVVLACLFVIAVILLGAVTCRLCSGGHMTLPLPRDLLAYWSSANLLLQRHDPYDLEALLELQRRQGWAEAEPVVAWNPPLLQVLMLPIGALSLPAAAWTWFILNPLLIGVGALCTWWSLTRGRHRLASLFVPALAFSFTPSVHTMVEGQITGLALLGLAGYQLLRARRREFLAGACCVLSLVKPHLVYLVVPLLLARAILERRWSILAGFLTTLLGLLSVATYLYPGWPISYLRLFQTPYSPMQHRYLTPTVAGLLYVCFDTTLGQYLWVALLPLSIWLFLRYGRTLQSRSLLNWSLIASSATAPFGWASDQVVLLLPILQIVARSIGYSLSKRLWILTAIGLVFAYAWWFWAVNYHEIPNLAIPLALAALYGYTSIEHRVVVASVAQSHQ